MTTPASGTRLDSMPNKDRNQGESRHGHHLLRHRPDPRVARPLPRHRVRGPLEDDATLFERLVLEINQAGLSWLTILKKREAFRRAYDGFDPEVVARYGARERRRLLADAGIVRNRLKILELRQSHGSFAAWLGAHHQRSKEEWVKLFKRTFRFTGGEIVGEFLMSIGYLPGAHVESCPVHRRVLKLRPPWSRGSRRRAAR